MLAHAVAAGRGVRRRAWRHGCWRGGKGRAGPSSERTGGSASGVRAPPLGSNAVSLFSGARGTASPAHPGSMGHG